MAYPNTYPNADPIANKYLQPDGSIATADGTQVSPPSAEGAQKYLQSDAIANKWLQPDGSITTLPDAGRLAKLEAWVAELSRRRGQRGVTPKELDEEV
jgi:hypothetical protein